MTERKKVGKLYLRKRKPKKEVDIMNSELLKYYARIKGYSMAALSSALGVNPATLTRKMSGESDFNRNEIKILKDCLGLSNDNVDAIFFSDETYV